MRLATPSRTWSALVPRSLPTQPRSSALPVTTTLVERLVAYLAVPVFARIGPTKCTEWQMSWGLVFPPDLNLIGGVYLFVFCVSPCMYTTFILVKVRKSRKQRITSPTRSHSRSQRGPVLSPACTVSLRSASGFAFCPNLKDRLEGVAICSASAFTG